jgi:hypothetical protein
LNDSHSNTAKAAMVDEATQYLYSSARDYAGSNGRVDVTILE